MLLALPYCSKDEAQAAKLMEWIAELGPFKGHSLLLINDSACKRADEIRATADKCGFNEVYYFVVSDDVDQKWPQSPNLMFRRTAKFIQFTMQQPWLWLEADAIPLKSSFLDELEAAYRALPKGKFFLGAFVEVKDVHPHMSGVAVYPGALTQHAGLMLLADEVAFDVVGASQTIPKMQDTKLICHRWKPQPYASYEEFEKDVLKTGAVIYHQDKTGHVIDLMRNPKPKAPSKGGRDILIKTYPYDYEWLEYCLRSIERYVTGFTKLIVVYPEGEMPPDIGMVQRLPIMLIPVAENGDPYLYQQAVKINAHEFSDADYILHIDSDTVFTQPVTPETFMVNGKPRWLYSSYADVETPWKEYTEKFLGEPVENEFMRQPPFLLPRALHVAASAFCLAKHKMRLTDYVLSQPNREFSEFNALGALAWSRARNDFHWINTANYAGKPVAIQHWSHDKLTPEKRAELDTLLSGGLNARDRVPTEPLPSSPAQNIKQTKEGIWVLANDSHISRWVEEHGKLQHDGQTLPRVLDLIKPGDVVVDVGAFIGDTTGPFLERVGPTGEVYAFEPNPDAYECLKRNCEAARKWNLAVSDNPDGGALIIDENAGASYMATGLGSTKTFTLNNLAISRLDLLKIDVEGYELRVLRGAEQTIARCKPLMVIEINRGALERQGTSAEEVFQWLLEHGYRYEYLQSVEGIPPQVDILCRPIVIRESAGESLSSLPPPQGSQSTEGGTNFPAASVLTEHSQPPARTGRVSSEARESTMPSPKGADSRSGGETLSAALTVPVTPLNGESREVLVRDAVSLLKRLCTSPIHTGKVRKELKLQGVIKKG